MITGQPIPWWEWEKYYESGDDQALRELTKNSFAVHYWNRQRRDSSVNHVLEKEQLLYNIFKANCPLTEERLLQKLIGFRY